MKNEKTTLDARGLSCPIPVVKTKEKVATLPSGALLEILVDEAVARENVCRFLQSSLFRPQVKDDKDGWIISVVK